MAPDCVGFIAEKGALPRLTVPTPPEFNPLSEAEQTVLLSFGSKYLGARGRASHAGPKPQNVSFGSFKGGFAKTNAFSKPLISASLTYTIQLYIF